MTEPQTPHAIREFVEATNDGDSERFVAAFTDDAHLDDWGREFRGRDGVSDWDSTDNIGKQTHFEVLGVEPGGAADSFVVTVEVTGNGFNGTSPLAFVLRGGLVADLRIS